MKAVGGEVLFCISFIELRWDDGVDDLVSGEW